MASIPRPSITPLLLFLSFWAWRPMPTLNLLSISPLACSHTTTVSDSRDVPSTVSLFPLPPPTPPLALLDSVDSILRQHLHHCLQVLRTVIATPQPQLFCLNPWAHCLFYVHRQRLHRCRQIIRIILFCQCTRCCSQSIGPVRVTLTTQSSASLSWAHLL